MVRKSAQIEGGYSQYLCFNIIIGSNNLTPLNEYSDHQQQNYDLIKSLHNGGMGYRKIAQYLNEKGIKTARGNSWRNTQVSSVLKRYDEKMFRQQIAMTKYEPVWSKMWLEFTT